MLGVSAGCSLTHSPERWRARAPVVPHVLLRLAAPPASVPMLTDVERER